MKNIKTIQKAIRNLRRLIDEDRDPYITRIAYSMETALRWATKKTVGWNSMENEAIQEAEYLKKETARSN